MSITPGHSKPAPCRAKYRRIAFSYIMRELGPALDLVGRGAALDAAIEGTRLRLDAVRVIVTIDNESR